LPDREGRQRQFDRNGAGLIIAYGAATGIDRSFVEACGEVGIDQEAHPARW